MPRRQEDPPPGTCQYIIDGANAPGCPRRGGGGACSRRAGNRKTQRARQWKERRSGANKPAMIICWGANRTPLAMSNADDHTFGSVMDACRSLQALGHPLFLEYHPGMHVRLASDDKLEMAAEMVAEYHNSIKSYMRGDVWDEYSFLNSDLFDALENPPAAGLSLLMSDDAHSGRGDGDSSPETIQVPHGPHHPSVEYLDRVWGAPPVRMTDSILNAQGLVTPAAISSSCARANAAKGVARITGRIAECGLGAL